MYVDLQTAADRAGVHYQTAYRWVRAGRLPATRVESRYRVDVSDLDVFLAARETPEQPAPPSRPRLDTAAKKLQPALINGDETTARTLVNGLVADGVPMIDLIEQVISPPLRFIGQSWHDGKLSIWVEHRASAIVERLLGDIARSPRGRRRGTVVVTAVSGDRHSLPTTMAAIVLRDHNWNVHHLGADMPPVEILDFVEAHPDVDVVVVTVANSDVADVAADLATSLTEGGTPAVVGAPGRSLTDMVDLVAAAAASPR